MGSVGPFELAPAPDLERLMPLLPSLFFPLDEELELLPGELSATLAEGVARPGTKMPFEQAAADLSFLWGWRWKKRPCGGTPRRLEQPTWPSKQPKSSG